MLTIDVFADVVCPWCYIGEHRLERALAQRPGFEAVWRWRPFQLQPQMPKEGIPWATFAEQKFGGLARAQSMFHRVAETGAAEGLHFDFDRVASYPNTVDAHRLILLAGESGTQQDAARAFFKAYFSEGADLNDLDTLVAIAAGVGMDVERVREVLGGSEKLHEVDESQRLAQQFGISGVPFFIFNEQYALSGAQPIETFTAALDQLAEVEAP